MEKLFVYGTLKEPDVQMREIGRNVPASPAQLMGYKKGEVVINGNTYAIALAEDDASIDGWIIEIASEELLKIDMYETEAYRRVKVDTSHGESWIYVK